MANKPAKRNQTNVILDEEALAFMREILPHNKRFGSYLSRLVFEDKLRREFKQEVARLKEEQSRVAPVTG